jgi:LysR family transcriptional regulator (chromosome initiation inhibitor)
MLDYGQLETLAAILRLGSFEAAAAELGVTQSAVSQRIRVLENRVGQPLIRRGPPCTGTELGLRLAHHAEEVALMERGLDPALGGAATPRRVRIAVNADSLAAWIVPALAAARAALPGLLFEAVVDDQDHSADWLRRGEVTAAVTATAQPPAGCDSHALGALRYLATCSPAFLAEGRGSEGAPALRRMAMMTFDRKDRLQLRWLEREAGPGPAPPTHLLPSTQAFIDGALAGLGWGMNPEPLIRSHLAEGRLVELLPGRPLDVPLFWQVSRRMAPVIAPLTGAVRDAARAALH